MTTAINLPNRCNEFNAITDNAQTEIHHAACEGISELTPVFYQLLSQVQDKKLRLEIEANVNGQLGAAIETAFMLGVSNSSTGTINQSLLMEK